MCGIAAIFGNHSEEKIKEMIEKISHRGPDEEGIVRFNKLCLGHKRLSIIDLQTGRQPLANEAENKHVVVNGEIYNHRQLRKELTHHKFRSNSDSEVIVHLYEDFGTSFVQMLDGMFAFILSDGGIPYVARDTLGIKPLYYGKEGDTIYFASELKALTGICEEIHEFPPGCYWTPAENFQFYRKIEPQWVSKEWESQNLEQICHTLRIKIEHAVQKRLMSDVFLGVFLSGGLDSSLIAAIVQKAMGKQRLKTFCVGTKESSDLKAARQVASFLGTEHHEYIYDEKEATEILQEVIYYLESFDPSLIRNAIPTFFVSRLAARHVKVVLSGEGSDELFSGYSYLKQFRPGRELQRELLHLVRGLHNINLQRVDRMTMAHSIEGRVPFLDLDFIRYSIPLPPDLKLYQGIEKWILRKAFHGYLPDEILWREKQQFAEGSGSVDILRNFVQQKVTEREFKRHQNCLSPALRSKEELYYYLIFKEFFTNRAVSTVGRWATA